MEKLPIQPSRSHKAEGSWPRGKPSRWLMISVACGLLLFAVITGQQSLRAASSMSWQRASATLDKIVVEEPGEQRDWEKSVRDKVYLINYHFAVHDTKYDGRCRLHMHDFMEGSALMLPWSREQGIEWSHSAYDAREKCLDALKQGSGVAYFDPQNPQESTLVRKQPEWAAAVVCAAIGTCLLLLG